MTPLESMAGYSDGHLLYKDIAGNDQAPLFVTSTI